MNFPKYFYTLLFFGLFFSACKTNIPTANPKSGSANFSNYIAIGNSLTAGYADGGLYLEGQLNSYPSMIATQMQAVGNQGFIQPLFGMGQENGSGYLKLLGFNADGTPQLGNVTNNLAIAGTATNGFTHQIQYLYTPYTSPIQNYGVPGIRLSDILTPGYGSPAGNPYFQRLLTPSEIYKTYQQKVLESNPTFFSSWLGNNDILGFTTSGGTVPITPPASFTGLYAQFLQAITAKGAKGVLGTIPDVTVIPFLNTITVAQVRTLAKGAPLYIITGTGTERAATNADLINLTTSGFGVPNSSGYPKGFDPRNPLLNSEVLDSGEVVQAKSAVLAYNNTITQLAASYHLALMDINGLLQKYQNGGVSNGVTLNLNYISGGIFSLDGVHLTPRGYALVANAYILAINQQYGSTLSTVNVSNYRGVKFP